MTVLEHFDDAAAAITEGSSPARSSYEDEMLAALLLGILVAISFIQSSWLLQGVDLLLLIWLPGILALRAVGVAPDVCRTGPAYLVAAGVGVLIATATTTNFVGPAIGFDHPLARVPLLGCLSIVCVAFLAVARRRGSAPFRNYLPKFGQWRVLSLAPALLPVLTAAGSALLTNGKGSTLIVIAVLLAGLTALFGFYVADRVSGGRALALVYFPALALIWAFSLRGHFVFGSDILAEYHIFTGVLAAHRWVLHARNGAYYSMASLTTVPTMLSVVSGASPLFIFKVLYPAGLAFFPVILMTTASSFLGRRFAYLAALVVMVQSYLFSEMPAIARQELGLLFFACLVAVLVDGRLARGSRRALIILFAVGMALSHYGTTYFAILMLSAALLLELMRRLAFRGRRDGPALPLSGIGCALAAAAVSALIWYVPVTHSTSNVSAIGTALRSEGLSLLPSASGHGVVGAYLSGNAPVKMNAAHLQRLVAADYHEHLKFVHPLPQSGSARFALRDAPTPGAVTGSPRLAHAASLFDTLTAQLINLLAVVGSVALVLRRTEPSELRLIALLGVATLGSLAVIRLSGTLAVQYNQERAFLQAIVPLAVGIGWLSMQLARTSRLGRVVVGLLPLVLFGLFLGTAGLDAVVIGGTPPASLSSDSEDVARFVVNAPEMAAARWFVTQARGRLQYADRYAQLRITAATGRVGGVIVNVMPAALDRYAWIYADTSNVVSHTARGALENDYSLYQWPAPFINTYWNRVYTNGSAASYARLGP